MVALNYEIRRGSRFEILRPGAANVGATSRPVMGSRTVQPLASQSPHSDLAAMPPNPGLIARVADVLLSIGERTVRQKNVFSGRGFLIGKKTFAIVWGESLIVKTAADEYAGFREEPGVTPFAPGGESPMGTWLVVEADALADDPELTEWLRRALRGIR